MRRISIFVWAGLLAIGLTFSARGQNISLVSQREPNTSSSISYGDVWAEGNIACLGIWLGYSTANYGVGIYDISDPANPILRSIYSSPTSSHNQFELGVVRNKIGYFGSWSSGGVHIVSLTNMSSPVFLSQIGSAGGGHDRVHTVFLERNFLYEAAHVNGVNTVKVIDVSNPFAPFFLRNIVATNAYKIHQITAVNKGARTILYTSDFGNGSSSPGQTDIFDVTDVGTQPAVWLGRIMSGGSSHSSWPTPDGNTLVVCRETTGGEVKLYDISNPANPVLQCTISHTAMGLPAAIPHNPVVTSNLLFLSWYQNGIQIFDITDRTKPVRIGSYDTYPAGASSSFQGNWGVFPNLGLDKLLLSDIQSGFYVLNASSVLTNTNNYPPLLVSSPANVTTDHGNPAILAATVTGSSLKYQWRFNNSILPGATNSSIVFNNVQSSDSGNYFVVATNSFGAVTSSVATLTVTVPSGAAPSITGQPQGASVYAGSDAAFSVAVTGYAPMSFQWSLNGTELPGATNNSLSISNVQPEQVGFYSVIVSNSFGTAASSDAALLIIDSPYLSNIQAAPGGRSALISWTSTVPSDSQVQFEVANAVIAEPDGAAAQGASFGNSSYIDRKMTTNHTMLLTGLTPGTRYSFQVISSNETNSFLSGVYQFTTAGEPIVLDNTNSAVTFVGSWSSSTNVATYYGTNYRYASVNASGSSNATFRPNITVPGKYNVFVWYPAGTDRAQNAPFSVSNFGGSNTFLVDQRLNGGQWNPIGVNRPFITGNSGFVRLHNNASASVVIADAVQFVYVDSQETPNDNSVPLWWETFYFGGTNNPTLDHDNDGFSTAEEYMLGTSPVDADSHLDLEVQAAGDSANITFWPYIGNRNYQLLYKTNITDPTWQVLSPGTITPTPYGHGIFSLAVGNTPQGYYRLAVQAAVQGDFSGKIPVPRGDAFNGFAESACGVNRLFVMPRRF